MKTPQQQNSTTPTPPAQITLADLENLSGGAIAADITPRPKKAKKKRARKDTRFRCQFRFWLDANKPDQVKIGEALADLKRQRRYMPTLRSAIRLFLDLRAGHTEVLFELFPWIVERLKPAIPAPSGDMERQIAELKQLILQQGSLPATAIVAAPIKQSGNIDMNKVIEKPVIENDDDELTITKAAPTTHIFDSLMAFLNKDHESTVPSRRTRLD